MFSEECVWQSKGSNEMCGEGRLNSTEHSDWRSGFGITSHFKKNKPTAAKKPHSHRMKKLKRAQSVSALR